MNYRKLLASTATVVAIAATVSQANATTTEFVPPNDTTGQVYTTNSNDGWNAWRGIGFTLSAGTTVNTVGLYHDLSGIDLSFALREISGSTGSFTDVATLASGSQNVTTSGLEWIDFAFADVALQTGKNYLLEFAFSGVANQNFYYNNANITWSQGVFDALDGTREDSFGNSVVAAFRAGHELSEVPLPAGLPLLLTGLGGLAFLGRKRIAA